MRRIRKWVVGLGLALTFFGTVSATQAAEPFKGKISMSGTDSVPDWPTRVTAPKGAPNVLVWMLDDVGFAQLGAYGGLIDTPNIDALAANGLRFNNFHTTALCSPSRAALMTGRNHHAVSVGGHSAAASGFPGYWSQVPKSAATVAKVLQQGGYATYALGKWDHLPNEDVSVAGPFDFWPSGQGFDRFYGFLAADINNFKPAMWSDHTPIEPFVGKPDYHLSTDITDKASDWINNLQAAAPGKPFFMYWATGAAHAPHHAPKSYIEKYKGKFDMGWDKAREMILERQKKLGVVPADTRLPERPADLPAWDSLSADQKRVATRSMEAFAGQLEHADHEFGRILATLERLGELDNTVVVVTSDNGASAEGGPEGTYNEYRMFNGMLTNTQTNLKFLDSWGGPDTYPTYPAGWAMAGNTPFKYYKQTVHEGGVRDPLIISWPKSIQEKGAIRKQFHHMTDLMPTLLEAAGVSIPKIVDGVEQQPLDGVSMAYTFKEADTATHKKRQYFEMFGNRGMWADGWKAVVVHNPRPWEIYTNTPFESDVWELYDTTKDFNELNNLAERNPQKLAEMMKLFDAEAKRNNVYPLRPPFGKFRALQLAERLRSVDGTFEYVGGGTRVHEQLAPPVFGRDYSITAQLDGSGAIPEGVVVAMGGNMGGYSLYVKEGRPVFGYNYFGEERYAVRSDTRLSSGKSELRFEFKNINKQQAVGTLFIDGKQVGQAEISRLVPMMFSINETFDIGRDTGSPVMNDYGDVAEFSGKIDNITFKIDISDLKAVATQ
ncbi:arylsulfatase [Pseudomonas sp. CG7]|nr:arylsulfatase [Pseudomonas sp. CG7]